MVKLIWNLDNQFCIDPAKVMPWILNEMSYPTYRDHKGRLQHYGCAQGYFGHTISLFLILKRDWKNERNYERLTNIPTSLSLVQRFKGIQSSTIHWRAEAENDLQKRLHKLMITVQRA